MHVPEIDFQIKHTVGDRLRHWAVTAPERRFFSCGSDDWTSYGEANELTDRLAAGLLELGAGKGHQIAFLIPNRREFVLLFLAYAKTGAVQVPLNPYLKGEFLSYQLANSEADTLVVDAAGIQQVLPILDGLPELKRLVLVGDGFGTDAKSSGLEVVHFDDLERSTADIEWPNLVPGDLISILYTSGTTGMPKGCMMSHGYYLTICREVEEAGLVNETDTILSPYQMFHTSGQVYCVTNALDVGAAVALEKEFHVSKLMDRARETNATVLLGPGAMGAALYKQPPRADDREHSVRLIHGVPIAVELQKALEERFGFRVCAEVYGQTEAVVPSITGFDDESRPGSAGRIMPHFEVRTVDDEDQDVPPGQVGEIILRPLLPHGMFSGYWKKPEATVEAWRNLWHHTGDHGRIDDGYLTFVGRKKDSVRRRGENVSCLELEQAVLNHPAVAGVACHAVPSALGEDEIKACLVLTPNAELTPDELFRFFSSSLPYFAIPRYVEVVDELPLSTMARVQKHKLVERGVTDSTWDFEKLGLVVERDQRRQV